MSATSTEQLRGSGGRPKLALTLGDPAGIGPELCLRLRRAGWSVHRLDEEMTLHDAAMTRFGQYAKRSVRSGWVLCSGALSSRFRRPS